LLLYVRLYIYTIKKKNHLSNFFRPPITNSNLLRHAPMRASKL